MDRRKFIVMLCGKGTHTRAHILYILCIFLPLVRSSSGGIYSQSECDQVTGSAILGSFIYLFWKALVMCWASTSRESIEQSIPEYLFDWWPACVFFSAYLDKGWSLFRRSTDICPTSLPVSCFANSNLPNNLLIGLTWGLCLVMNHLTFLAYVPGSILDLFCCLNIFRGFFSHHHVK